MTNVLPQVSSSAGDCQISGVNLWGHLAQRNIANSIAPYISSLVLRQVLITNLIFIFEGFPIMFTMPIPAFSQTAHSTHPVWSMTSHRN